MRVFSILLAIALIAPATTFAQSVASVRVDGKWVKVFVNEGWENRYPIFVVRVTEDTKLLGNKYILSTTPSIECTLAADSTYHPWSRKIKTHYATVKTVNKYVSKFDQNLLVFYLDSDGFWVEDLASIDAGDVVYELDDTEEEGNCFLQVNGRIENGRCLRKENFELVKTGVEFTERLFLAQCQEGTKAWIIANDDLLENDGITLEEINEPGQID